VDEAADRRSCLIDLAGPFGVVTAPGGFDDAMAEVWPSSRRSRAVMSFFVSVASHIPLGVLDIPQGVYRRLGTMDLPDETVADLIRRLRRVEGQVRGLHQMLAEGRDCREIVTQMSAANKALEQAGFLLVAAGLTWCLEDPERSAAEGYELADVQKMFTKLA
jgi:DNA-binding FrmR family transcriptional regulator